MTCDDPDAVAWRIISLLDGLALQTVAHGDLVAREDANGWARELRRGRARVGAWCATVDGTPRSMR